MRPTLSTWAFVASFLFSSPSFAAYNLKDDYNPTQFFSMMDFFTDSDPTDGYVDYQSQSAAQSANLISTANNQIYMGVDSTSMGSGRGRKSVRVTSKAVYNHALIVLDLQHMPGSICGTWPAFWTVGPNWPASGEIDIIEGVNTNQQNAMTLHTGPGCSISGPTGGVNAGSASSDGAQGALFSGSISTSNCDINAAGQAQNAGCSIGTSNSATYGDGFNAGQGGVYATEWTSSGISIWFFPRSMIPSDVSSGSPDPTSWGTPVAHFGGSGCDIDDSFKNQQIVFDTTFCGQWAGAVWSTDSTCSSKAATCQDYVQNNPSAFKESFWTINSLKVYTSDGSAAAPSSSNAAPKPSASGISSAVSSKQPPTGSPIPSSVFNPNTIQSQSGKPSGVPVSSIPSGKPPVSGPAITTNNIPPATPSSALPPQQQTNRPTGGQPWNGGQSWSQNGGGNTQWSHESGGQHRSQFSSGGAAAAAQVLPTNSVSIAAAAINSVSASASSSGSDSENTPYAVVVGSNGVVSEQPVETAAAAFIALPTGLNVAAAAADTTVPVAVTPTAATGPIETVSIPTSYDVPDPEFTVPPGRVNATATTTFMTVTQTPGQPLDSTIVVSLTSATGASTAVLPWETWATVVAARRRDNESEGGERRDVLGEEVEVRAVHAHMNRHRRSHGVSRRRS